MKFIVFTVFAVFACSQVFADSNEETVREKKSVYGGGYSAPSYSAPAKAPAYAAPASVYAAPAKAPAYAQAPVYAAPAKAPAYAPGPGYGSQAPAVYSYQVPAPTVPCPKNLVVSCAPSVSPVPCAAPSYKY